MMRFFVLFLVFMMFQACNIKVVIDNPSTQTLYVEIDHDRYIIEALKSELVNLRAKQVQVVVRDSSQAEILNQSINIAKSGVLNPSLSLFVIQKDIYCSIEDYDHLKKKLNLRDQVVVNEKEYENVDFTLTNDLFIPQTWDYGLDEAFPKNVSVNKFQIVSKIFRIDALEKSFGYMGHLDFSNYSQKEMDLLLDSLNNIKKDSL